MQRVQGIVVNEMKAAQCLRGLHGNSQAASISHPPPATGIKLK
jgi:hypothetical protein